jgi:hypothetical protein
VDFEFKVEYELTSSDIAELMVTFGGYPRIGWDRRVVGRGHGSVTMTRRMLISPGLQFFDVTVGLSPPSTAYDKRNYTITPQPKRP